MSQRGKACEFNSQLLTVVVTVLRLPQLAHLEPHDGASQLEQAVESLLGHRGGHVQRRRNRGSLHTCYGVSPASRMTMGNTEQVCVT